MPLKTRRASFSVVYTKDVHKISGPVHIMSAKDYLENLP